ncbi:MAG: hypothetical protein HY289_13465 [Planctomycetes bacterium]|nr:hypothetical protein [Planctomycetota bacterium]
MDSIAIWLSLLGVTIVIVVLAIVFWFIGKRTTGISPQQARDLFQQDRSRLQTAFFDAAAASGKPRGLRWTRCQFSDLIEWLRDKQTGQLLTLVGVTISFEAIEGGDMEGVEAVGNLRNASAVFFFQDGRWQTTGRVVFNLNPDEAVQHFQEGYEQIVFV